MGKTSGSWKPGQSGNPKGGPKKNDTISATLRKLLLQENSFIRNSKGEVIKGKIKDIMCKAMIMASVKGNAKMGAIVAERVEGKVAQDVNANLQGNIFVNFDKDFDGV